MRILITNDDGIMAPGLAVLTEIATTLAGPTGEVWTVAPQSEQSGVGHCISYTKPVLVHEYGKMTFAVEGSPADCVLAALNDLMPQAPDLVLSGINKGNNAAENTMYSGTIGAAIEAAMAGIPAIALSQFYGPGNTNLDDSFEASRNHGVATIQSCMAAGFTRANDYAMFYNVNFPPVSAADVLGTKVVTQGYRGDGAFGAQASKAPNGRKFLFMHGRPQQAPTQDGTDAAANLAGYISVTPMRADLTARDHMDALAQVLDH
ncbi:MAG: 5'/3'-nucleotidase SurE [Planktomarina sp.]